MPTSRILFLFVLFIILGCAAVEEESIQRGNPTGNYDWELREWQVEYNINSEPSGANIYVNDVFQGTTPKMISVPLKGKKTWPMQGIYRVRGNRVEYLREERAREGEEYGCLTPPVRIVVSKEGYRRQEKVFACSKDDIHVFWNLVES